MSLFWLFSVLFQWKHCQLPCSTLIPTNKIKQSPFIKHRHVFSLFFPCCFHWEQPKLFSKIPEHLYVNTGICCLRKQEEGAFTSNRRVAALLIHNRELIKALTSRHNRSLLYSLKRYSVLYYQKKCPKPWKLLISRRRELGYCAPLHLKLVFYAKRNLRLIGPQKVNNGGSTPIHSHLIRSGVKHSLGELTYFAFLSFVARALTTYTCETGN